MTIEIVLLKNELATVELRATNVVTIVKREGSKVRAAVIFSRPTNNHKRLSKFEQ